MDRSDDIEERIRFAQDRQHARLVENYRELKRNYDAMKESELSPSDVIRKAIDVVTRKDLDIPERKKTGRV